jgi:hypothetical protein
LVALSQHFPCVLLDDIELGDVEDEVEVCAIPAPENPAQMMAAAISPFLL